MDTELQKLHDGFRGIRTTCTGIMGYLAMLHEGAFEGREEPIVKDLRAAADSVMQRLEALRDAAASIVHGRNAEVDAAAAIIIAAEEQMRQSVQVLSAHLASLVPGVSPSYWKDDLQRAQAVIREVAAMNDALKAAHAAHNESSAAPS